MKINKKSWHYRYYDWTYDMLNNSTPPRRTNLCNYFWRFPLASLALLFLYVIAPIIVLGGSSAMLFFIGKSMIHHLGWWNLLIAAAVATMVFLTKSKIGDNETVQLVGAYVAAKKQGVCPLIEFEDDSSEEENPLDRHVI